MEIILKRLPRSAVEIEITVPEIELELPLEQAAERMSKKKPIKGFRPGKTPRNIVEKYYGAEAVLGEAMEDIVIKNFSDAAAKENLDIIGKPEIALIDARIGSPIKFKVSASIFPDIKLGGYKNIKLDGKEAKIEKKEAKEEEIIETLDYLRKNTAKFGEDNAEKDSLPELDDKFAASLGKFKDLNSLKTSIKEGIEKENFNKEKEKIIELILKEIIKNSEIEIPEVFIENETKKISAEISLELLSAGVKFEDYLKESKKTVEDIKKEQRSQAEERIKKALVLFKIAKNENINISNEDLDAEVSRMIFLSGISAKELKKIDLPKFRENTRIKMTNGKVFELLEKLNITNIEDKAVN